MEHGNVGVLARFPANEDAPEPVHPAVRPLNDPSPCSDAGLAFEFLRFLTTGPQMKREPESDSEGAGLLVVVALVEAEPLRVSRGWPRATHRDALDRFGHPPERDGGSGGGDPDATQAAPAVELPAGARQSGGGGARAAGSGGAARLRDGVALHEAPRPRQAPATATARAGAGIHPTRATALRGRPRARAVALRFPRRQAQGAERQRRVGHGDPVCRARRSLAAVLPRAVVRGRREYRKLRARPLSGLSETRAAARAALRQRLAHAGGRDARGARAAVGRAPHDPVANSRAERQAGGPFLVGRGAADAHARG